MSIRTIGENVLLQRELDNEEQYRRRNLYAQVTVNDCSCFKFWVNPYGYFCHRDLHMHLNHGIDSVEKAVVFLNHESIHIVLRKIAGKEVSKKFDRLFRSERDVDEFGLPKEEGLKVVVFHGEEIEDLWY
ncbi:MAG: hypothetical protein QHH18_03225 [Candidatus Bathyarchaeota archaeon]|jgi:hypothetical protein|nr:hypothetical protein [Candidatus Bathyarchaeota archaeon A05DMB-5]MDH7557604.1 hypothetical protein [Candidatus Bathyarchaeota archaeon]